MAQDWIDVSVPLRTGMVHWPGDPDVQFERLQDMERGDVCTVSRMALGAHTGTHMDAPLHYLRTGTSIDQMPLSATIGRARVIAIADPVAIAPEELRPHRIRRGERVLFKTRNSARRWHSEPFFADYVFLAPAAARYLAARRVRTGARRRARGGAGPPRRRPPPAGASPATPWASTTLPSTGPGCTRSRSG